MMCWIIPTISFQYVPNQSATTITVGTFTSSCGHINHQPGCNSCQSTLLWPPLNSNSNKSHFPIYFLHYPLYSVHLMSRGQKEDHLRIYRKDFPNQFYQLIQTRYLFVLLTLNASVADMCWMLALSRIKASNTLLIYSFHSMLVGILSHYIFHDHLNKVQSSCLSNPIRIHVLTSPLPIM